MKNDNPAVKFADANVGGGQGFTTYPLYALGFLPEKAKEIKLKIVDVKNLKVPE